MAKPKLKTVINKLEKMRQDYIAKYGVEPLIWNISEDNGKAEVELCSEVTRDGMSTKSRSVNMSRKIDMALF